MKKNKKLLIVAGAIVAAVIVVLVLFGTHILCIHKWNEATCEAPKTCAICGDTEGKPLGHETMVWSIVENPTCSKEGKQEANCKRCGKMLYDTVDKLDHINDGKWTVTKEYVINPDGTVTPGTESILCSVCGEEIESREYTIELTPGQKNALIMSQRMIDSIHPSYKHLVYELLVNCEGFDIEDAKFAGRYCGADWNEQALLYAQELYSYGESEKGIRNELQMFGFTGEEIDYAITKLEY